MQTASRTASHSSIPTSFLTWAKSLKESQPHLTHVLEKSRFRGSLVTIHDYGEAWQPVKRPINVYLDFSKSAEDKLARKFIKALHDEMGAKTKRRVIIVEDLCHQLLQNLGRTFNLSPEVFEDYLVNSGWYNAAPYNSGRYDDTEPNHWKTRRLQQEHITLRWYRPCTLTLKTLSEESLELSRDSILFSSRSEIRIKKFGHGAKTKRRKGLVQRDMETGTNIWRRHLDLRVKEGEAFREGERLAWEERATIWQRKEENGLFGTSQIQSIISIVLMIFLVIILLDPSPLAFVSEYSPQEPAPLLPAARNYLGTTVNAPVLMDLEAARNMLADMPRAFRGNPGVLSLVADDDEAAQIPLPPSSDSLRDTPSVRSESGVLSTSRVTDRIPISPDPALPRDSAQTTSQTSAPQAIQETEDGSDDDATTSPAPLHTFNTSSKPSEDATKRVSSGISDVGDPSSIDIEKDALQEAKIIPNDRLKRPQRVMTVASNFNNSVPRKQESRLFSEAKIGSGISSGFLLKNVAARGPTESLSLVSSRFDDAVYRRVFQQTTSTAYDLNLWMDHEMTAEDEAMMGLGPVSTIFNVIDNDIEDFLLCYNDFLDGIEHMSHDLDTVERRLPAWRSLMNHAGNELRYLEEQLPALAVFITSQAVQQPTSSFGGRQTTTKPLFDINGTILPRLIDRIQQAKARTQHSSDALVASVSFLESRRGIEESRGVNRLTQLAFFFIPISFAASFYGMQVKELSPATTSIWQFFVMTAGLTTASYIGFFLQSAAWKDFLYRQRKDFRRFTQQRYNMLLSDDNEVNRAWIWRYIWEKKFGWLANIAGIVVVIIPIIPVWTSSLVQSIKLIISLSTLLASLLAVSTANWASVEQWLAARSGSGYRKVEDDDDDDDDDDEEE